MSHSLDSYKEFRSLASLLTIVTAINNGDYPIPGSPSGQGHIYDLNGLLDLFDNPAGQTREILMSSLLALLVCDIEVVALTDWPVLAETPDTVKPDTKDKGDFSEQFVVLIDDGESYWERLSFIYINRAIVPL